ncbi:DNA-binding protein [Desulfatitalea alkaliphila]|uniref:DNA-binding protein n=1 Tax=Desulfatitalea alkaliphila TaxID=2929485 RepID=A0AA41R169_9BACT|nr:DNA-binding protein [Desulfatitalea alkaliphila]MCJ8499731.1 DNA-binding protein [Desulfatitalea alkaliphila]
MKTKLRATFLFLSAITLSLSLYACGEKSYGSGLDPKAETKTVSEIFTQADLQGRKVTIEGRIHAQCPTNGCWFVLQDGTGQIYVDLSRNGFELPPMQGRAIAATGVVSTFRGTKMMVAEGVVLK